MAELVDALRVTWTYLIAAEADIRTNRGDV
jgi:hypothetical protein